MSDQAFADATRPAPRTVLRVPLLHYSLGHEILLERERNELKVLSFEEIDALPLENRIAALMRAVLVCSRTWQENQRPDKHVRLWGWLIRKSRWEEELFAFHLHRLEGSSCPRMAEPSLGGQDTSGDGRTLGSPYLARLMGFAVSAFGQQAFDQPFGMLQWMYFAKAEVEGSCMVENAREKQIREEIQKYKEDYAKEQAALLQT